MNIITSWILKYTQEKTDMKPNKYDLDTNLNYNECDAFFILAYVCKEKKWRNIYKPGMEGVIAHLSLLTEVLSTGFREVY